MSGKDAGALAALELFDERFQDLAVGVADQLGRREHLCLRLQRHLTQIGSDLIVERQVQAPVDPGHHRSDGSAAAAIFRFSRRVSTRAISRKTAETNASFESKCR